MSLVFDRRGEIGERAAIHALIVGVGAYPHLLGGAGQLARTTFGLHQIPSAVTTALRIFEWLSSHDLALPLATVRLLISPPHGPPGAMPPTLDHFLRAAAHWREDARSHSNNATLVYLVGHGLEISPAQQIFLLQDFGDGYGALLKNAIDVDNLVRGMGRSNSQGIALTQWYFFDFSSIIPQGLHELMVLNSTPVFDVDLRGLDDREAAIFYAAASGEAAHAIKGEATFFSSAVLMCLEGHGSAVMTDGAWAVTSTSLTTGLQKALHDHSRAYGFEQHLRVSGSIRNGIIRYLEGPPPVEVMIALPPELVSRATVELRNQDDAIVIQFLPNHPHPLRASLPAGMYSMTVLPRDPGHEPMRRLVVIVPPFFAYAFPGATPVEASE